MTFLVGELVVAREEELYLRDVPQRALGSYATGEGSIMLVIGMSREETGWYLCLLTPSGRMGWAPFYDVHLLYTAEITLARRTRADNKRGKKR